MRILRAFAAATVLVATSACGVGQGDSAGALGNTWVLRFDRSTGGADGEELAAVYLSATPDSGKAVSVEMPPLTAGSASGLTRLLMVDSSHTWALLDSAPTKAEREAHQVALYPLAGGEPQMLKLGPITPDYLAFAPEDEQLTVVAKQGVWHVDAHSGQATQAGTLQVKKNWTYAGGFVVNTGEPYTESLTSFETDPSGNGATDTIVPTRNKGSLVISPTNKLKGLPDPKCDLVSGFKSADGTNWVWCVTGQDLQLKKLSGSKWSAYGKAIEGVVPKDVVEFAYALPPLTQG